MDDFHTSLNRSLVAYNRDLAAHADAPFSETLDRLLACTMPLGMHRTPVTFATKLHANLAVRLPRLGPYYAFEWVLIEKCNGRRRALASRRVAHSRL